MNIPSTSTKNQNVALKSQGDSTLSEEFPITAITADMEAELTTFFRQNLQDNFATFPDDAKQFYLQQLQYRLRSLAQATPAIFHVAKDKEIVGLIWSTTPEGGVATLIWLMISQKYQRRGIGKQLLDFAKNYYQQTNTHKIKLTVHQTRAQKFYEREGFICEGKLVKHWWSLDCWSMGFFFNRP